MKMRKQMKQGLALLLAVLLYSPAIFVCAEGLASAGGAVSAEGEASAEKILPAEEAGTGSVVLPDGGSTAGRSVSGGEDGATETGYVDGTNNTIQWSYDSATKTTMVRGSGVRTLTGTYPLSSFPAETEKIVFEECIIEGSLASFFNKLDKLVSVDFTGLKMQNITDMAFMFNGCSSLTELDLSSFETSSVRSMSAMFQWCEKLSSLDLSSFNTENVVNMSWMFNQCRAMTDLNLSSFDTSQVKDMELMFQNCTCLTALDLSSFSTGNVMDMYSMFAGCGSLSSINLSSFDTQKVARMGYMFYGCRSLPSVDLSNFNTSNVTGMDHMFYDCGKLTNLDLSSFDAGKVTDMNGMLEQCKSLVSVHTPYNVVTTAQLPSVTGAAWYLSDGTEVTTLPLNQSGSVLVNRRGVNGDPVIVTTTTDLNMDDVIRVKYVPYSYTIQTNNEYEWNKVTYSIIEGRLAEGLQMYPDTGEIYGIPLEAGEFKVTVMASYSSPQFLPSYAELTLIVIENTDENVGVATDPGYEIIQPVENLNLSALPENGSQLLVSNGNYPEFLELYIDGRKLVKGEEYTSEEGSTRITILNQTLAGLSVGSHTLGIEFRTLGEEKVLKRAAQNFIIRNTQTPEDEGSGNGSNSEDSGGNSGSNGSNSGDGGSNSGGNGSNSGDGGSNSDDNGSSPDSNHAGTDQGGNGTGGENGTGNDPVEDDLNSTDNTVNDQNEIFQGRNGQETSKPTDEIYTVMSGDTLWRIAVRYYGNGNYWKKIYNDNKDIIRNPDRIYIGQKIRIHLEDADAPKFDANKAGKGIYRVAAGDSLWKISQKIYGSGKHWEKLYRANQKMISNPGRIYSGQEIVIPE